MVQLSFPLTEKDGYRLELAPFNNCSIYQLLAAKRQTPNAKRLTVRPYGPKSLVSFVARKAKLRFTSRSMKSRCTIGAPRMEYRTRS
jgi:hypothetical protein